MKNVIFSSECVAIKEYMEARFNMSLKPDIYICGQNIKFPIKDITTQCAFLENDDIMDYKIFVEDDETVEVLVFDGLKIELHTAIAPECLLEDSKLKEALKIGIVATSGELDLHNIPESFSENGYKIINHGVINHGVIYKEMLTYKTYLSQDYFLLSYPPFPMPEKVIADLENLNEILNNISLKN